MVEGDPNGFPIPGVKTFPLVFHQNLGLQVLQVGVTFEFLQHRVFQILPVAGLEKELIVRDLDEAAEFLRQIGLPELDFDADIRPFIQRVAVGTDAKFGAA